MDLIFSYVDLTLKVISGLLNYFVISFQKDGLTSDAAIIALSVLLVLLLLVLLKLLKKNKTAQVNVKSNNSKESKAKQEPAVFTEKFKASVAAIDLDLKLEATDEKYGQEITLKETEKAQEKKPESKIKQLTKQQQKELNLDLKALQELLEGGFINKAQFDQKEKDINIQYGSA